MASKPNAVPPYGHRKGYIPRTPADFGDGGAFPEIHVRQHPRPERKATGTTLAQTVAADGSVNFGSIAQQGGNKHRTVFSSFTDLIPKPQLATGDQLVRPDEEEVKDTAKETAKALQQLVEKRVAATNPKNLPDQGGSAQLIKYTPATQTGTTGAKQRLIKIQDAPVDPLEPPKFRHMKAPKGSGSPPVPVMHSPPRAATKATLEDWKIPPMVSNWKNPKGFIIPLDKRLAADGRGLQTTQINDNFAKFAEALSVAESRARESVNMRQKMRKELAQRERDRKEEELRAMAARAREERLGGPAAAARVDDAPPAGGYPPPPPAAPRDSGGSDGDEPARRDAADDDRYRRRDDGASREDREALRRREEIRRDRAREREREQRLAEAGERGGRLSKLSRDKDRDISEKVALGQANIKRTGEAMYDQRLFNQDAGMASGFAADDAYNLYDKALYADRSKTYKAPAAGGPDDDLGDDAPGRRFKPTKGFAGADSPTAGTKRGAGGVEFEKAPGEADPFGLDDFLSNAKRPRTDG